MKIVCLLILMLPVLPVLAQQADSTARIEEVTIIGDYSPVVKEAFKIRTNPVIQQEEVRMPALNYAIKSSPVYHKMSFRQLRPEELERRQAEDYRKNFLKLGFGNYTTPYIEFFANMEPSSSNSFGVHLKHLSSSGDIKDYAPSAFSGNLLDVFGKKIWRKHVLNATAGFQRDVVHFYGFDPSDYNLVADDMDADTILQKYMMFNAAVDFASTSTKRRYLDHSFGLSFYNLSDNYETTENNVFFKMNLESDFKIFKFTRYQSLGLDTKFWLFNNKFSDSLDATNAMHLSVTPYFAAQWDEYRLKIGADLQYVDDVASDFSAFPHIEAGIQILPGTLELNASYTGGIKRNSFRSLSNENPWISPTVPTSFTKTAYKINGNVAAKILPVLDLTAGAEYSSMENMPFFVTDTLSPFQNEFTMVYDNVSILHLYAESVLKYQQRFKLTAAFHYYNYTMDLLAKPWHKPDLIASLSADYRLLPELLLNAELIYRGKQYAPVYVGGLQQELQLDGTLNLNFGAEYFFFDYLSAWLRVNNALNDDYMRYINYPTQGLSVMGGVSFSF